VFDIGTQQSPIWMSRTASFHIVVPDHYLYPDYSGNELQGHIDPETKNFVFEEFEYFTLAGQPWVARKIHFHKPAEHRTVGRERATYEAHILHTMGISDATDPDATGPKLVLATFFHHDQAAPTRKSARNLNELLKAAPAEGQGKKAQVIRAGVNPLDFLPARDDWSYWYKYEGSLTSKPFSEDVSWYVFDRDTGVQDDDFSHLAGGAEQDARQTNPLVRRYVLRSFA